MISNERQLELFNAVVIYFTSVRFDKPSFVFNNQCIDDPTDRESGILDTLGYFSCKTPDSVFLCTQKINDYSTKKSMDSTIVAEIVAIHEIAHYIHYSLLGDQIFCNSITKDRTLFVESFAQLLTHKVCQNLSIEHYQTFDRIKVGQSEVYTDYYSVEPINIGKAICYLPWDVLLDSFVNISEIPNNLFHEIGENLRKYLDLNYPDWRGDGHDDSYRLIELGLAKSKLMTEFEQYHPNSLIGFIS